jgi:MoaD family protein
MKIRYFAILRNITGKVEEEWNAPAETVQDVVDSVCQKYGPEMRRWICKDDGCFGNLSIILINGVDCRDKQGMQTQLKPDDNILIFPPMAGG